MLFVRTVPGCWLPTVALGVTLLQYAHAQDHRTATVTTVQKVACEKHHAGDQPCYEYGLKTGPDTYHVQPKKKESGTLNAGEEVELQIRDQRIDLRRTGDRKSREYRLLYVTGNFSGELYHVGNGVSAPEVVKQVSPEFSEKARKAKYEGVVVLSAIVDTNGRAVNIRIVRSAGKGLDEKAIQALQKWQFKPAVKDGHPVAVASNFEINFRLY